MEQCRILGEYAQYVEKVRKNAETMSLDVAVKEAMYSERNPGGFSQGQPRGGYCHEYI